jgi:hypothetical protein
MSDELLDTIKKIKVSMPHSKLMYQFVEAICDNFTGERPDVSARARIAMLLEQYCSARMICQTELVGKNDLRETDEQR